MQAGVHLRAVAPTLLIATSMLGLALTAYWRTFGAGFVWDDYYFLLQEGKWLLEGDDWIARSFREFIVFQGDAVGTATNYFRPLVMLGFVAQMRLSQGDPAFLHGVSLGLHLVNSFLVIALCRGWQMSAATKSWWPALVGGALFLLHPALVEPVAWISGQFDLWVTLFTLLALTFDTHIRRAWPRAMAVSFAFLFAALCKETAVVLPALLAITHWHFATGTGRNFLRFTNALQQHWRTYVLVLLTGLGYLGLRWISLGHLYQSNGPGFPWMVRVNMFGHVYLEYWRLAILPFFDLSPIHEARNVDWTQPDTIQWLRTSVSVSILAFGLLLAAARRPAGFAMIIFSIALLPVLHFLPMMIGDNLYHERFLTLPLGVLTAASAAGGGAWIRENRSRSRELAACILIALWAFAAFLTVRSQVPLWANNQVLWNWAYAKNPDSQFVRNHMLVELINQGRFDDASPIVEMLEKDGEVRPETAITLSSYYIQRGYYDRALHMINGGYENSEPGSRLQAGALANYARLLAEMHDLATAEEVLRATIADAPEEEGPRLFLVRVLAKAGKSEEASRELTNALIRVSPLHRDRIQKELQQVIAQGASVPKGALPKSANKK